LVAILCHGCHDNGHHFEFVQPQKLAHTTVDIPTKGITIELDEIFQKFCLTCVHILRLSNFRMAAVATKNVKHLMCSELDET
jgi:hypothetical protein